MRIKCALRCISGANVYLYYRYVYAPEHRWSTNLWIKSFRQISTREAFFPCDIYIKTIYISDKQGMGIKWTCCQLLWPVKLLFGVSQKIVYSGHKNFLVLYANAEMIGTLLQNWPIHNSFAPPEGYSTNRHVKNISVSLISVKKCQEATRSVKNIFWCCFVI